MIVRGLWNIVFDLEQHKYHGRITPNYCGGTRKDVWIRIKQDEAKKRKERRVAYELAEAKRRADEARASHEMHLAMGCDDRDCRVC